MAQKSAIEWTDATWNCVRGCSRISEGCRNCYAERIAARYSAPGPFATFAERKYTLKTGGTKSNWEPHWTGKVELIESKLDEPLHWHKPRRIFVNSMSDLFHEALSDNNLLAIFTVMGNTHIATGNESTHQFQVLTKRAERMQKFCSRLRWKSGIGFAEIAGRAQILNHMPYLEDYDPWVSMKNGGPEPPMKRPKGWMPAQIWLGVSIEDPATADSRIPCLLKTPARMRFISYEPALEAVDLTRFLATLGIDWVIMGGESGPGARPMHPDWALSIRDQCQIAGVPFFFKQWGEWTPGENVDTSRRLKTKIYFDNGWVDCADDWTEEKDHGPIMYRVGKKAAGAILDGREWREFPAPRTGRSSPVAGLSNPSTEKATGTTQGKVL